MVSALRLPTCPLLDCNAQLPALHPSEPLPNEKAPHSDLPSGLALELASPLLPSAFLLLACLGSICRAVTGVAGGATRMALTQASPPGSCFKLPSHIHVLSGSGCKLPLFKLPSLAAAVATHMLAGELRTCLPLKLQ